MTKNGHPKILPMNDATRAVLLKRNETATSTYAFTNRQGNTLYNIRKSFLRACASSDIINFTFHDLRHCFASNLAMSGADLNTIRELMGHRDVRMTLRYSHLTANFKQRAVDALCDNVVTIQPQSGERDLPVKERIAVSN